jgi:signal peptidase I
VASPGENPISLSGAETEMPRAAPRPRSNEGLISSIQSLAATVVIALFVITFVVQAFQIPSQSMENTLQIGDYLLVDKVSYGADARNNLLLPYRTIKRDDVVVFKWPIDPHQHFVKRVVGLPGDRVHLANGKVFINGVPAAESFAIYKQASADPYRDNFPTTRYLNASADARWLQEFPQLMRGGDLLVPEDHYFVLGDNRNESSDSRYWGFVPRENVVGRPLLIYFSVRQDDAVPMISDDRIESFMARISSLSGAIRWDRSFRFVK